MSPRSAEFMEMARDRLAGARNALESGFAPMAVSAGYYAMLYAARAALSEEEQYAKTHSGTWRLFTETFVKSDRFDAELARRARVAERERALSDYEAKRPPAAEASDLVTNAERFVHAIERMIAG